MADISIRRSAAVGLENYGLCAVHRIACRHHLYDRLARRADRRVRRRKCRVFSFEFRSGDITFDAVRAVADPDNEPERYDCRRGVGNADGERANTAERMVEPRQDARSRTARSAAYGV